jgi:cellulose biosynthesis protein BcsQ
MSVSEIVQLIALIAPAVGLIGTAVWWCLRSHLKKLYLQLKSLEQKNAILTDTCTGLKADKTRLETDNTHREQKLDAYRRQRARTRRWRKQAARSLSVFRAETAKLTAENADLRRKETERQKLEKERDELRSQSDQLQGRLISLQAELESAKGQWTLAEERRRRAAEQAGEVEQQLHRRIDEYQAAVEGAEKRIAEVVAERDSACERADRAEAEAAWANEQINQVLKQDERVWERPVTSTAFQPLSIRHVPIIAVLNLKGGVGKTTITANLAGVMAKQGKPVMVIDADYQRNLSLLLLSDNDRKMLHLEGRTLQHFLAGAKHDLASLLHTASEVPNFTNCRIVTNTDTRSPKSVLEDTRSLEDVEMHLLARYLLDSTPDDVRLALRESLHDLGLQEGCRYVLIDCPPRLSTACINALAACDFFLVPVILDATSAVSVPNLLRILHRLRAGTLFPQLRCLGVVANNVHIRNGEPINREADIVKQLPTQCRATWGSPVHLFKNLIPHSGAFAEAAGPISSMGKAKWPRLAIEEDDSIYQVFRKLLSELESRVEHESQNAATVPAHPALSHIGG